MVTWLKKLYGWIQSCVHSDYAHYILGFLFYIEALIFLPTDPLLVFYCIERKSHAFRYALIATVCSVLGAITAYTVGLALWHSYGHAIIHHPITAHIISPATFDSLMQQYKKNMWLALIIPGFIPIIPYKAVTLSAGFCQLSLIPFIICSCIARGSRFLLYATIITFCSNNAHTIIKKSVAIIMALTLITVVGTFYFLR
jgi:membrane protein YqaA with SNARE-associated domain